MMTNSASRIVWIDWMKAASIMAVVLYHTNMLPEVTTLSYILCLPAFFFTAGMFADDSLSFGAYFRKKTVRLLIPYVCFGLLAWLAWLFVGRYYGADAETQSAWYEPLIGMLCGTSNSLHHNAPLWFLTCLISLEWLYFALSRCRLAIGWQIVVLSILAVIGIVLGKEHIILPWGIATAMIMLPVYWLGRFLAPILKVVATSIPMRIVCLILLIGLLGLGAAYMCNPEIKISHTQVGNPLLFYIGVLSSIAVWFALAQIFMRMRAYKLFAFIGSETLWILGLHMPFFGAVKGVTMLMHVPLSFYNTIVGSLTLWTATFTVLALGLIPVCRLALEWIDACRKRAYPGKEQSPTSQDRSR